MFDIGWSEFMLIGIVALIVIGPKELPSVLRTVGKTVTKLRRMAGEFQGQFNEALREAELSDIRTDIGNIVGGVKDSVTKSFPGTEAFDPLRSIREDIRTAVEGGTKSPADAALPPETPIHLDPPPPAEVYDPYRSMRDEIAGSVAKATGGAVGTSTAVAPLAAAPTGAVERTVLPLEPLVPLPEPAAEPVLDTKPDLSQNHAATTPVAPHPASGGAA